MVQLVFVTLLSLYTYLQNLNNLQLSVHHGHVFLFGSTPLLVGVDTRLNIRHIHGEDWASTEHHLGHHLSHPMDGSHDIVSCMGKDITSTHSTPSETTVKSDWSQPDWPQDRKSIKHRKRQHWQCCGSFLADKAKALQTHLKMTGFRNGNLIFSENAFKWCTKSKLLSILRTSKSGPSVTC